MTLSDLEGHSPIASLFVCNFFNKLCSSLQDFNWHCTSCSPFATAEVLVCMCGVAVNLWDTEVVQGRTDMLVVILMLRIPSLVAESTPMTMLGRFVISETFLYFSITFSLHDISVVVHYQTGLTYNAGLLMLVLLCHRYIYETVIEAVSSILFHCRSMLPILLYQNNCLHFFYRIKMRCNWGATDCSVVSYWQIFLLAVW